MREAANGERVLKEVLCVCPWARRHGVIVRPRDALPGRLETLGGAAE